MQDGRKNIMLILSSPSGVGKTTLTKKIQQKYPSFKISVSNTTRTPRSNEVDGIDYHFVSKDDFHLMINNREMLEYAKVFDHYYGTPSAPVMAALAEGRDVLFDIDWQGTQQLADANKDDLVTVFILPPSTRDLEKRLLNRAQDSADIVATRMSKASDEISHYREYDYILINDDIDQAVSEVRAILYAERLRRDRLVGLTDFVKRLLAGW